MSLAADWDSAVPIASKPDPASEWDEAKPVKLPRSAAPKSEERKPPGVKDFAMLPLSMGEAALNMGTGLLAKPASDVAGLAATGKEAIKPTPGGGDPAGFKRTVQEGMTYQPRTQMGQDMAEYNPMALLAKLLGWGGEKAGRLVAPPGESGPVRSAVGNAVQEAVPQLAGIAGMKGAPAAADAAAAGMKGAGRDMMHSALKPPPGMKKAKADEAIETLLQEGASVTSGGLEKLQGRISDLNQRIAKIIDTSPATVDKRVVASTLTDTLKKFEKQVNPLTDIRAIQKAWDEFLNHPILNGNDIPVKTAQEMKQSTYKSLGDKAYGELKGAEIEAQKTLARGLKEEIAKAVPEVRALNAEESKLLAALPLVERRVMVEANKNPAGLGWLTQNPAKFAAWMADRSAAFKSLVARMLYSGADSMPPLGTAAGPAIAASGQLRPPPPPQ